MYIIEDIRIVEPDEFAEPGSPSAKKRIYATIRCDGYEADSLTSQYGDTIAPLGRSEVGASYITVTVDFSADPRTVAKRIKDKIAEMKVDRTQEKVLLGQLSQLGGTAINP
jgi:hypothetical protein